MTPPALTGDGATYTVSLTDPMARLIHRISKIIPAMALTVVWNVEYGRW